VNFLREQEGATNALKKGVEEGGKKLRRIVGGVGGHDVERGTRQAGRIWISREGNSRKSSEEKGVLIDL